MLYDGTVNQESVIERPVLCAAVRAAARGAFRHEEPHKMNKRLTGLSIVAALLLLAAAVLSAQNTGSKPKSVVRYDRDSRYYRIIVSDYPDLDRRVLYFSKTRGAQSSMILSDPNRLGLAYLRTTVSGLALHPAPRKVLLIGLGGAAIPKFLAKHYPDIELHIVEIDPDVVQVASRFFSFQPTEKMKIFVVDGRIFLTQSGEKYDLILLDAYASDSIPFHLTTQEFFQLVKAHLNPGGVVAANMWEYFINKYYLAELKTVQSTFPQTYLFLTPDPASKVLFATLDGTRVSAEEWRRRAAAFVGARDVQYDLPALVAKEYTCISDQVIAEKALTDNMAPVDLLRTQRAKQ